MIGKLLNLQAGHFKLNHIEIKPEALTLVLESRSKRCRCPLCHKYSYSIHSKYQRSIQNLPCFAHNTRILLIAHKFYCRNHNCTKKIFTERFTCGITPYTRKINRLSEQLAALCFQSSCRCAERICKLLHIQVSDSTMDRLLYYLHLPDPQTLKVLGVDDWAMKKRNLYGTILVDLEQHKIIDLLKDREADTLQKWLEDHPGTKIVSRDRWHLLKNLCEGLHKLVERNHQFLKYARRKEISKLQRAIKAKVLSKQKAAETRKANEHYRQYQFRQIKLLFKKGIPKLAIARNLGMSRNTVKKYLHLKEPPGRKTFLQVNIALFDAYIRKRFKQEPYIELKRLFQEIKQRGYNGCCSTAYEYFHKYVNKLARPKVHRLPDIFYVPSKISFLLLRKQQQLQPQECKLVNTLCKQCPEIKTAYQLAREFKEMME